VHRPAHLYTACYFWLLISGSGPHDPNTQGSSSVSGAAVNTRGTLYVLAVGLDHALWVTRSTDGTHWSGWSSLGGRLTAGVGAGSAPGGMTWAVTLGTDNHVWQASGMWPALRWSKAW
jgi:hypothetical protein